MNARWLTVMALGVWPACGVAHHDIGALQFEQRISRDVDILFVVDNSPGMGPAQTDLSPAIGALAEAIESKTGPLASFHAGFISSDMGLPGDATSKGNDGALVSDPSCTVDGAFISSEQGVPNFVGSLGEALTCLFDHVGLGGGSAVQQPFAAVIRALDGSQPLNKDFRRAAAALVVVFVSGQDDCSPAVASTSADAGATSAGDTLSSPYQCARLGIVCDQKLPAPPTAAGTISLSGCRAADQGPLMRPAALRSFFEAPDRFKGQVFGLVVAGPIEPFEATFGDTTSTTDQGSTVESSCVQSNQVGSWGAQPPVRLQQFADEFRDDLQGAGTSTCICSADSNAALASCTYGTLADRMTSAVRSLLSNGKCLNHAPRTVVDSGQADAQCTVTIVPADDAPAAGADAASGAGAASVNGTLVPPCAEAPGALCWRAVADPNCVASGFALQVERTRGIPASGTFEVDCFL